MSHAESDFTEAMRLIQRIFLRRKESEEEIKRALSEDEPRQTTGNNTFIGEENENADDDDNDTPAHHPETCGTAEHGYPGFAG